MFVLFYDVKTIYNDYLAHIRNVTVDDEPSDDTKTPLNIMGKTTNVIKHPHTAHSIKEAK